MANPLRGNIWKYGLLLISNKRIFIAILGAYYLTIPDVNVAGVGLILLMGQLSAFILEIPSGYVSDKLGHKRALIVSHICFLLSTVLFLLANHIVLLIAASVFLSAAFAFHSGTGSAFMHETLKGLGWEKDYAAVMGKLGAVGFAVPIAFTAAVPFLVGISFKLPFVAALVMDLVGLAAALALKTPPVPPEDVKEIGLTNFRQVLQEGRRLGFLVLALFSGILSGMLLGIEGFRPVYQVFLGIPVIWFGVLFGVGRTFASLMLAWSGKIRSMTTLASFCRLELVIYAVLAFVLGAVSAPWIVALVFIIINAFHWGLSNVGHSYAMEIISASKFKATLLSVQAQLAHIVGAVASFAVGWGIQSFSYQRSFLGAGIVLVVLLLPLYLVIARRQKKTNQDIKFS